MKKCVFAVIVFDMLIIWIAYNAFQSNYSDVENQQIMEISKLVFQAAVTGFVTFTGLFLTIYSQDVQLKKKERTEICACLIINYSHGTSASKNISNIVNNKNVIICSEEEMVRTVECVIVNCKNNYALNLSVESTCGEIKLGIIKDTPIKVQFALKEEAEGEITFKFEDIYGMQYKQKVVYEYQQRNNEYQFVSQQPQRRTLL